MPGLRHLAWHWGAIALLGGWIAQGLPGWQIALLPQGILLVFLFTLLHETTHHTPFRSQWLNTVVGHVCGLILVLPATWFRFFHLAHHRYTQVPDKDPELGEPKPETPWGYVWHVSGVPTWIGLVRGLIRVAAWHAPDDFVPHARARSVRNEARAYLAAYALAGAVSLWAQTTLLLYVWIIPMVLGQPFLRLYLLAEHGRCPMVADMFENTRTTFTNRIVRALARNMPYHAEHHAFPNVPFHSLPTLHDLAKPHLKVTQDGYAAFHADYVRDALD